MHKDRVSSVGKKIAGSMKEAAGNATADREVEAKGRAKSTAGKAQHASGNQRTQFATQSKISRAVCRVAPNLESNSIQLRQPPRDQLISAKTEKRTDANE